METVQNENTITEKIEKKEEWQSKRALPFYGKGEEIFNAVSHIVGGGLSIIFSIIAFVLVSYNPSTNKYAAVAIYSFSMITLFTISSIYHFLRRNRAKKVFRILDHCTIFLLIAGCYTPFCLISFYSSPLGIAMFCVEWGLAIIGITLNAVNMHWKAVKIFSNIAYLVMGWLAIFFMPYFIAVLPTESLIFLIAGGVAYTVGIIFYAVGKKKKWMHSVWHLFVVLGAILQFVSIVYIL
ncbi:MAG: hemolysin III family protein [Candidatus Coproplasma sp.]